MTPRVKADGSVLAELADLQPAIRWMQTHYRIDVEANRRESPAISRVILALAESVRIREAAGPISDLDEGRFGRIVTTQEAAALMSCTPRHIRRMCEAGKLKAYKSGDIWLVDVSEEFE